MGRAGAGGSLGKRAKVASRLGGRCPGAGARGWAGPWVPWGGVSEQQWDLACGPGCSWLSPTSRDATAPPTSATWAPVGCVRRVGTGC